MKDTQKRGRAQQECRRGAWGWVKHGEGQARTRPREDGQIYRTHILPNPQQTQPALHSTYVHMRASHAPQAKVKVEIREGQTRTHTHGAAAGQ